MLKGEKRRHYKRIFFCPRHLVELLQRYAVPGHPSVMEPIEAGEDNLNLVLRDAAGRGVAVARHYLVTPSDRVASELRLVAFLADHGFPTPRPLLTRDGKLFIDNGNQPSIAVFPFVFGIHLADWSRRERRIAAQVLAVMHELCRTHNYLIGRTKEHQRILETGLRQVSKTTFEGKEVFLREVERFLAHDLADGMRAVRSLPFGPIHHDLNTGNVLWGSDGEFAALLDFDEAHDAPSIMDLVSSFQYLGLGDDGRLDLQRCQDLIQGYEIQRPLFNQERGALQFCWNLTAITSAMEFVTENSEYLGSVMECRSFSQLYLRNRDWVGRLAE